MIDFKGRQESEKTLLRNDLEQLNDSVGTYEYEIKLIKNKLDEIFSRLSENKQEISSLNNDILHIKKAYSVLQVNDLDLFNNDKFLRFMHEVMLKLEIKKINEKAIENNSLNDPFDNSLNDEFLETRQNQTHSNESSFEKNSNKKAKVQHSGNYKNDYPNN